MRKYIKISLLASLIFFFCLSCITGIFVAKAQSAIDVDSDFFNKVYAVNSKVTIPDATIDGKEASVTVTAPSGATVYGNQTVLAEEGTYTVVYTADGQSVEKTITTKLAPSSMFTVSDNVTLTDNQTLPDYILNVANGMEHTYNTSGLGVYVEDETATLHYNGIVNFNDIMGDGGSSPFMEMIATPAKQGVCEFKGSITFKFTDIHDPENFFTMTVSQKDNFSTIVKTFDRYGKEFVPIEWGQYLLATHSFQGLANQENCINPFSVYFYASREFTLYMNSYKYNNEQVVGAAKYSLGSLEMQGRNALKFASNEAYLDITFDSVLDGGGSFILTKFLNTELNKDFLETDDFHYAIETEEGVDANNLPYGVINYPYTIPSAYGYNIVAGVKQAKYYVTDSNGNIYVGSAIYPQSVGVYTIHYSCEYADKKQEFSTTFKVFADFLVKDRLNYNISDDNVIIGQPYVVKAGTFTGGIGNVNIDYKLFIDGVETELDGQGNVYYFTPYESDSVYVIKHYVSDDLQTKVYDQTINVIGDKSCYFNDTYVPEFVMVNRKYQIITPSAYYFDNDGAYQELSTKLVINGQVAEEFYFDKAGEYKVKFQTEIDATTYYSEEKTVTVVSDEAYVYSVDQNNKEQKSYLYNFFKAENGSIVIDSLSNNIGIRSNHTDGSLTNVKFLVPVSIKNAYVSVKIGELAVTNFKTFNVKINDLKGESITVKFGSESAGSKDYVVVKHNDNEIARYESNFVDNTLRLNFNAEGDFYDGDNFNVNLSSWDSGFVFDGFSDYVWLEFQLENVTGNSTVYMDRIGNQTITKIATDRVAPYLQLEKDIPSNIYIALNESYVFPLAYSFDLLQQYSEVYVSVETLAGLPILIETKLEDEFVFEGESRGEYLVIYTAYEKENRKGQSAKLQIYIKVETDVLPTISLQEELPVSVAVGETLQIPKVIVNSPISTNLEVYVIDPDYSNKKVEDGKVKIEKKGTYIIRFIAVDEDGNIAVEEHKINYEGTPSSAGCAGSVDLSFVALLLGVTLCVFVLARRNRKNEKI